MSPLQSLQLLIVQLLIQRTVVLSFSFSFSSFIIEQSPSSLLSSSSSLRSPPNSPSQNNFHQCHQNRTVSEASVVVVRSNDDIQSLADLRYHEWIVNNSNNNNDDHDDGSVGVNYDSRRRIPSLSSFRLATSEIYHERVAEGSTMFLAMMDNVGSNHDNNTCHVVAVGAAELSPIELQGVYKDTNHNDVISKVIKPMYITDVVTSSSFRNCGIGSNMMRFVESYAWKEKGTRIVYLHVAEENVGARKFYERLGYRVVAVVASRVDGGDDDGKKSMLQSERPMGSLSSSSSSSSSSSFSSSSLLLEKDGEEYICSRIENGLIDMDYDKLAANAGAIGQILMMKRLSGPPTESSVATFQSTLNKPSISRGGGFGRPKGERKRNK